MSQNKNSDAVEQFEQKIESKVVDSIVEDGKLVAAAIAPLDGFDDYVLHYSDDLNAANVEFEEVRIEAPYRGCELESYR